MKTGDATPFCQLKAPHQTVIVKRDTQSLSTAGPFVFIRVHSWFPTAWIRLSGLFNFSQGHRGTFCHYGAARATCQNQAIAPLSPLSPVRPFNFRTPLDLFSWISASSKLL